MKRRFDLESFMFHISHHLHIKCELGKFIFKHSFSLTIPYTFPLHVPTEPDEGNVSNCCSKLNISI